MASWLRLFLLNTTPLVVSALTLLLSVNSYAEEKVVPLQVESEQLIQPEIERRTIALDKIDTEDFEATLFTGLLSIEDFGANPVTGARFAYHINEDIFVEGTFANSTAGKTTYEEIGGYPLLTSEERDVSYYNAVVGYNLLPGESFLTRNTSFNSALYIVAGVGTTTFAGADRLTISMGGGFRLLATDWLAFHIDARNHTFSIEKEYVGKNKTTNNLEITIGVSVFF